MGTGSNPSLRVHRWVFAADSWNGARITPTPADRSRLSEQDMSVINLGAAAVGGYWTSWAEQLHMHDDSPTESNSHASLGTSTGAPSGASSQPLSVEGIGLFQSSVESGLRVMYLSRVPAVTTVFRDTLGTEDGLKESQPGDMYWTMKWGFEIVDGSIDRLCKSFDEAESSGPTTKTGITGPCGRQ